MSAVMAAASRAGYWCPIYYVVEGATTLDIARGRVSGGTGPLIEKIVCDEEIIEWKRRGNLLT